MTNMWAIWVVAGLALLALEAHQTAFFAIFLSVASFAAALVDVAGGPLWLQGVVFAIVGFGGVLAIRRYVVKHFQRHEVQLKLPGVYGGFVGQEAEAVDEIGDEQHPGHARLGSETFLAVTDGAAPLSAHTKLIVAGVRGTTLLVREQA